jgi:RNA polymerase sigma factor (TIGR02999 family)
MRRILIETARRKHAIRHGGALQKLSASVAGFDVAATELDSEKLQQLSEALDALAAHDRRKAEVVKQVYFVGLTLEEIAQVLDITERTVRRDLSYAKAWLLDELSRSR